jgi:hypothetical protein
MILPTSFASGAKHYLAGVLSAAWNGGISGVSGIVGVDAIAFTGVANVQVLNWQSMASAFLGAFVIHGVMWLKAHPLPEEYETTAPFTIVPKTPDSSPADSPTTQKIQ